MARSARFERAGPSSITVLQYATLVPLSRRAPPARAYRPHPMSDTIAAGDSVLLTLQDGKSFLVRMQEGGVHSMHKGAIEHDDLIGRPWGSTIRTNTDAPILALRPRWVDQMMKVKRRTNIMYPKEVSYVLAQLDIGPGDRVIEIGSGSGAMTQALARAVRPGGHVFSYDRRPEFQQLARRNLDAAGVPEEEVTFRTREAGDELEPNVAAVFTDIPEPWAELDVIHRALVGSGRFAAGTPTFNQAERLAEGLSASGFGLVETIEILVREILAREGRTRPAHRMIGHTQLITTAVKVFPDEKPPS